MTGTSGVVLSNTLVSQKCGHLYWLDVSRSSSSGLEHVFYAIKMGSTPQLRHLDISWSGIDYHLSLVLSEALLGGTCSQLECLMLSGNPLGDDGVHHLSRAIGAGGVCPNLRTLILNNVSLGEKGAMTLGGIFKSASSSSSSSSAAPAGFSLPSLSSLSCVHLDGNEGIGDDGMSHVIKGLSAVSNLRSLSLGWTGMGKGSGEDLLLAMTQKRWPKLTELSVVNESLGGSWISHLATALTVEGVGCYVRHVSLYCSTSQGFHLMASALRQGALPNLASLSVTATLPDHDDGRCIAELKSSLAGRARLDVEYPCL